jgi:acetolactate synthase regulatory subunit
VRAFVVRSIGRKVPFIHEMSKDRRTYHVELCVDCSSSYVEVPQRDKVMVVRTVEVCDSAERLWRCVVVTLRTDRSREIRPRHAPVRPMNFCHPACGLPSLRFVTRSS